MQVRLRRAPEAKRGLCLWMGAGGGLSEPLQESLGGGGGTEGGSFHLQQPGARLSGKTPTPGEGGFPQLSAHPLLFLLPFCF